MARVLFTSDPHFGHKRIHKFRTRFSTPEEHDIFIYNMIIKNVGKRDVLWILGDICFDVESLNKIEDIAKKVSQLNIVLGNHDESEAVRKGLCTIGNPQGFTYKYGFWIGHYPIHPLELRGKPMIHGHMHAETIPDNRYFSVCPEVNNWSLVNLQEIKSKVML